MINLHRDRGSADMLAGFLAWWRWPAFRFRSEAPKYSPSASAGTPLRRPEHYRQRAADSIPFSTMVVQR